MFTEIISTKMMFVAITIFVIALILTILSSIAYIKYKIELYDNYHLGWLVAYKIGKMRVHSYEVVPLGIMAILGKKIKLKYKKKGNTFFIYRKVLFGFWHKMEVIRYGDLDDDIITVCYDNENDARKYCGNVVKHNAVADEGKQIFEETNHGDLF